MATMTEPTTKHSHIHDHGHSHEHAATTTPTAAPVVIAGNSLTYNIVATNNGPSCALDVSESNFAVSVSRKVTICRCSSEAGKPKRYWRSFSAGRCSIVASLPPAANTP